jgi:hypothetical protein
VTGLNERAVIGTPEDPGPAFRAAWNAHAAAKGDFTHKLQAVLEAAAPYIAASERERMAMALDREASRLDFPGADPSEAIAAGAFHDAADFLREEATP